MKNKTSLYIIALVILGLILFFGSSIFETKDTSAKKIELRWLIAHEPTELWDNATEKFAEVLAQESDGNIKLIILGPSDVSAEIGLAGDVPNEEVFRLLDNEDIEMSSTLVVGIGNKVPSYWETNLPFLFNDLDDAYSKLNNSAEGNELIDSFTEETNMRAFAFTLSGGFRVLASNNISFQSLDDIKGKRIITTAGPVGEEMFRQLGALPLSNPGDIKETPNSDDIDAVEIAYTRLSTLENLNYVKNIYETNHSVFMTSIIARDSFYDSLSTQNKSAIEKAAKAAARAEWDDSVALADEVKQSLIEKGVIITELSTEDKEEFKKQTESIYDWFEEKYGEIILRP